MTQQSNVLERERRCPFQTQWSCPHFFRCSSAYAGISHTPYAPVCKWPTPTIRPALSGMFLLHMAPTGITLRMVPSSVGRSGRWRWTFPAGSWRWWTGRPWPPCSRWHTSDQKPRSGPAGRAEQWPRSPTIWNIKEHKTCYYVQWLKTEYVPEFN